MQNKISFKPRTCPNCNHKVGFKQYLKTLFFESTFHKWNCENCGIRLQFNLWFRLILAISIGLWIYVVLQLRNLFDLNVFSIFGLIILLLAGSLLIYSFDLFRLGKGESQR